MGPLLSGTVGTTETFPCVTLPQPVLNDFDDRTAVVADVEYYERKESPAPSRD